MEVRRILISPVLFVGLLTTSCGQSLGGLTPIMRSGCCDDKPRNTEAGSLTREICCPLSYRMSPLAGFVQLVLHLRDMRLILGAKVGSWQSGLRVPIGRSLGVGPLLHGFGLHANMISMFHFHERLHSRYGNMNTWCLYVPSSRPDAARTCSGSHDYA